VALNNTGGGIHINGAGNVLSHNRALNNAGGNWSALICSTNTCVQYSSGFPSNIPGP